MARHWKSHPLEDGCPPAWASAWGQDRYGVWVEFRVGTASQTMRWIMPGSFLMGSPADDTEAFDREELQRRVTIGRGFWLFDTPCCQDLWQAVTGENPSRLLGERRPVEGVNWDDARGFIQKLNAQIPELWLRLPKEAEWEYACRAGTTASRYGELDSVAWYLGNSEGETHDVGLKQANPWGLHDMLGNVWEWCEDPWRENRADTGDDKSGVVRVIRGGGWDVDARVVRAAYRYWYSPVGRSGDLGFRCLSSGIEEGK